MTRSPWRIALRWQATGILLAMLSACAGTSQTARGNPTSPTTTTITRESSYPDQALAARGLGRVELVVRSADHPTQTLPQSMVVLRSAARDSVRAVSDERGLVRFDSLRIGTYEVAVRRIGYGSTRGSVVVKPGCRTDVEVYVSIMAVGLAPPPPMPGRVVATTCR
jgi:hypothetical protein